MRDRHSVAGVWVIAIGLLSSPAAGQMLISSSPACQACGATLERVVSFSSPVESSWITWRSTVAQGALDRFYVTPVSRAGEIHVYNADGGFHSSFTPQPEFEPALGRFLSIATDQHDSLHIVDNTNRQHVVLSSTGVVGRRAALPNLVRVFDVTHSGQLIVEAEINTRNGLGRPVHLLSVHGVPERSFGSRDDSVRPDSPHDRMRVLSVAGPDRFWLARVNRYELNLLSLDGDELLSVVRDVDWFVPWHDDSPGTFYKTRPLPRIVGIVPLGDQLVAVLSLVPEAGWEPVPAATTLNATILDDQFDTVVEVLDTASGEVKATLRSTYVLNAMIGGPFLYSVRTDEEGHGIMTVWRVLLD